MTRKNALQKASYTPDGNVATYRPEEDGRNVGGERIQFVPMARVHPSPGQTRLVQDVAADRLLRDDIATNGVIHPPVVRPCPGQVGEFEVVVGHRRLAALRTLAQEGRGQNVLRFLGGMPDEPLIPVLVRDMDEVTAQMQTVSENLVRADLRPWEQALALWALSTALEGSGGSKSVRKVAGYLNAKPPTIAPYFQAARSLGPEVLTAAGLEVGSRSADEALCALSLQSLLRAARKKDTGDRAATLRAELERVGVLEATEKSGSREATDPRGGGSEADRSEGDVACRPFSLTIRKPIRELDAEQARRYLGRIIPVVAALMKQAGEAAP